MSAPVYASPTVGNADAVLQREGRRMSLATYGDLVRQLIDAGYRLTGFPDADPGRRDLVLRHDVDMCLDRALLMAKAEAAMGVKSVYFVLLNTEMYNAGSRAGRAAIGEILSLGHEVGLHFDPSDIAEGDVGRMQSAVAEECERLQGLIGRTVEVVTFHRPAKWLLGYSELLAGRLHGYQPRFFTDMGYCSDSEGRFRFHHPLEHPAVQAGLGLQLVIHPIWWCAGEEDGPLAKLERFLSGRAQTVADEMAANCRPYAEARKKG